MSFFQPYQAGSRLYAAGEDAGWLAYLFPASATLPPAGVDVGPALTGNQGSFLFAPTLPDLSTGPLLAAFIAALDALLLRSPTGRGFVWIAQPANVAASAAMLGFSPSGQQTQGGMVTNIVPDTLQLTVSGGATLALNGNDLQMTGSGFLFYSATAAPNSGQASQVSAATLAMTGTRRGCLQFDIFLQRKFLFDPTGFSCGQQFLAPQDDPVYTAFGVRAPLAFDTVPNGADMLGFSVSFDPSDPFNLVAEETPARPTRSVLVFTGGNQDSSATVLASAFATTTGAPISLVPVPGPLATNADAARLVFNNGRPGLDHLIDFQAAPDGDFILQVPGATADVPCLMLCGLHGTEFLAFRPAIAGGYAGDRLSFVSRSPAFAALYPFQSSSPIGPPSNVGAALLDDTYRTSWATLLPAPDSGGTIAYVAQPKGAPLYGRDLFVHAADQTLLGSVDPSIGFPGKPVPMLPYGLVPAGDGNSAFNPTQVEDFEARVLGPVRRGIIGTGTRSFAAVRHAVGDAPPPPTTPFNATTPTGLIATVGPDGSWQKLLLGQNLSPQTTQMCFCAPDALLQQAFQTGQLFLVVANAQNLGPFAGAGDGTCTPGTAAFYNSINVGDWWFEGEVGNNYQYGDYANVMIVKGRKGALWNAADPTGSLIANPQQWTLEDVFAAPSHVDSPTPNKDELVALSYWLQQYFTDASNQADNDYFGNFNAIATNAEWTGILFLRMSIAQLPDELVGIRAGVSAPHSFNAHHLGIEISQVANDPQATDIALAHSSSIFGLIYYLDPAFTPPALGDPPVAVAPASDGYDFKLLELKALFENTAVQKFQSFAQLALPTQFQMSVDHMGTGGNPFAALMLTGRYQDNGGKGVYSLASATANTFYFNSNIFNKIEIDTAVMSTRDVGSASRPVTSWFGLTGCLDFRVVDDTSGKPFDIFSFGTAAGADPTQTLRQGLSFSNLGLEMQFPVPPPDAPVTDVTIAFDSDGIRFDPATSTPRTGSIYVDFALSVQGLTGGDADNAPAAAGYLPVITDARLGDLSGSAWYGIAYQLDLGSPGALAEGAGLKSGLLTAWSPTSAGSGSYTAELDIKLPGTGGGAKLISLQNVLKLSIGMIRLTRGSGSFLLMLTDIALRFLGLLKIPPNGATLFYLFGNPNSGGKPSGLGWYAMYSNEPQDKDQEQARPEAAALPKKSAKR